MVRLVLYRAENYWYWYLLGRNQQFHNNLPCDGREKQLRKALVAAREAAKRRGLIVSTVNIEKDE